MVMRKPITQHAMAQTEPTTDPPPAALVVDRAEDECGLIKIVEATEDSLRADLLALARSENYADVDELDAAISGGEISPDSWTAWEYRGLRRLLEAEPIAAE
jgi:hypothetical protein